MATATSHLLGDCPPSVISPGGSAVHQLWVGACAVLACPRHSRLWFAAGWEVTLDGAGRPVMETGVGLAEGGTVMAHERPSVPKCRSTK